jgi:hypothetical protein
MSMRMGGHMVTQPGRTVTCAEIDVPDTGTSSVLSVHIPHSRISVHSRSAGIDHMPSIVLRRVGGAPMPQEWRELRPLKKTIRRLIFRVSSVLSLASLLH